MAFESAIQALEREQREAEMREEHANEKHRAEKRKQVGDWTVCALGTFVACQSMGITPKKFPLGYTAFVFTNLGGDAEGMIKACREFVETMQVPLGAEYERREKERKS